MQIDRCRCLIWRAIDVRELMLLFFFTMSTALFWSNAHPIICFRKTIVTVASGFAHENTGFWWISVVLTCQRAKCSAWFLVLIFTTFCFNLKLNNKDRMNMSKKHYIIDIEKLLKRVGIKDFFSVYIWSIRDMECPVYRTLGGLCNPNMLYF